MLGRAQRRVLAKLGPLADARRFYLAGGTGLARDIQEDDVALRVDQTERGWVKALVG